MQNDQVFLLIKSLTKAEKRNFTLYVNRSQNDTNSLKYIQLFEVMDKLEDYDEKWILEKLPDVKKRHLANLKRHLYRQILTSLRLIYIQKNIDIEIREQIDFARILYGKGMYMQALRILERIKQTALEHQQDILHLEILEFEKLIEARHITRSRTVQGKMETLLEESAKRSEITLSTSLLFNFNIQIHGYYIEHGHARDEVEAETARIFYQKNLPTEPDRQHLTFFERANLFQAQMWYAYILLDFAACREHALAWANLFEEFPQMKEKDPDLYMRGIYYLLVFLYFEWDLENYKKYLGIFEEFEASIHNQLNTNSQMIAFVYLYLSKLNIFMMTHDYEGGLHLTKRVKEGIKEHKSHTDIHRILLFYFKFAYLHYGKGDYDQALECLKEVIVLKHGHLREDLHHNARILQLICHFELGHYDLLSYLVGSVRRAFAQAKDVSHVQRMTVDFIKKLITISPSEHKAAFAAFQQEITKFADSPYERKALLYLDVPGWIDRHVQNGMGATTSSRGKYSY